MVPPAAKSETRPVGGLARRARARFQAATRRSDRCHELNLHWQRLLCDQVILHRQRPGGYQTHSRREGSRNIEVGEMTTVHNRRTMTMGAGLSPVRGLSG